MNTRLLLSFGFALAGAIPAVTGAQALGDGQGVADRSRPGYDPIGARVGAFTLYPSITTTAAATDNYLATDTNRRGDAYLFFQPELVARSDQGRERFEGRAFAAQSVHASLGGENITQFGVSGNGAFDATRNTQLRADASVGRFVESRSSLGAFQGSAEPVVFEVYHAGLGASHSFNDLTLGANSAIEYRNFHDAEFPGGQPIDQDYRDVRQITVGGSAQYALRNGIGLIVSGQYLDEHYNFGPGSAGYVAAASLDRDSTGFNIDGGITLELTKLIFGRIQIGYLSRHYPDPRLDDVGGLSYSADLLWNVTPLTSLRFRASRSIEDTSSPQIAGNTRSDFHLYADHELYRYIIVSADAGYSRFRPNGVGIGGDEYSLGGGARYLINRRLSVSGNVRYSGRSSDSTFLRYHAVLGTVSLRVAF